MINLRQNRFYLMQIVIVIIVTGAAAWILHEKWLVIIGLLWLTHIFIIMDIQKRKYENELAIISRIIDGIINESDSVLISDTDDLILSKLQHQMIKLQSVFQGYNQRITADRDSLRSLISEIAHQLRNPLANIRTYLALLKEQNISLEEYEKCLDAIEKSEQKLDFLVESFIKVSRLENGIIQIRKADDDLKSTVLGAILQVQKTAEAKNIEISLEWDDNVKIRHDRNWLAEAIYNLLDNSIKYSENNSRIKVSSLQNDMFAQVTIADQGIGISREEESLIFKRFYRGTNVTSQEGIGLGLYLVREIVNRHGGFIKIKKRNAGTAFSIYLPTGGN
ncbi:MAG: sensor histidine kinase [Lachnospiraceae bacterium]